MKRIALVLVIVAGCGGGGGGGGGGTAPTGTFTALGPAGTWWVAFAFHPTDPNVIYGGMDDSGGFYKSVDGGASFQYVSGDVPNVSGWTIAIDPANPARVWVGDSYGRGVYRSLDGGAHWALANAGLGTAPKWWMRGIHSLRFHPTTPGLLCAYTYDGLYTCDTNAASPAWVKRATAADVPVLVNGEPNADDNLRMDVHSSGALFVGGLSGKIYRAATPASAWTLASTFAGEEILDVDVDGTTGELYVTSNTKTAPYVVNVRRNVNGLGDSWTLVTSVAGQFGKLAVRGGVMYLATSDITVSPVATTMRRFAGSWSVVATFNDVLAISLEMSPLDPGRAFMGGTQHGFRTVNGTTWTPADYGLRYVAAHSVVVDPANPSHLFLCDVGLNDTPGLGGVFESADGGATWTKLGGYPWSAWRLAMAPGSPLHLLAGTWRSGVKVTFNGGATWTDSSLTSGMILKVAFGLSPAIAFAVSDKTGVHRSTDFGVTWSLVLPLTECTDLIVDASNPTIVYATGYYDPTPGVPGDEQWGPWKSTNGGASWTNLGLIAPIQWSIARDAANPSILYVGTVDGRLYRSSNGGASWSGAIDPGWQGAVLVVSAAPDALYVGVNTMDHSPTFLASPTSGFFRSSDGGATWTQLNASHRPTNWVATMTVDPSNPKRLYVTSWSVLRYDAP